MRVTLRRRQGDRTNFIRSRLDSVTTDYSRDEGLVEIVHVEINDEDTKPPRSAVTIAKNVAREARRAGLLKKTGEPGHVRTLRLRDWPDTCSGLGICPPFVGPLVLKPGKLQEPRGVTKGGPLYEKPGVCPACGGELVDARLRGVRELFVCKRACYNSELANLATPEVLEVPFVTLQSKIRKLGESLEALQKELDEVQALLNPKGSTPRS